MGPPSQGQGSSRKERTPTDPRIRLNKRRSDQGGGATSSQVYPVSRVGWHVVTSSLRRGWVPLSTGEEVGLWRESVIGGVRDDVERRPHDDGGAAHPEARPDVFIEGTESLRATGCASASAYEL